jgi:hypothetical protein
MADGYKELVKHIARYLAGGALLDLRGWFEEERQPCSEANPREDALAAEVRAVLSDFDAGQLDDDSVRAILGWRIYEESE